MILDNILLYVQDLRLSEITFEGMLYFFGNQQKLLPTNLTFK